MIPVIRRFHLQVVSILSRPSSIVTGAPYSPYSLIPALCLVCRPKQSQKYIILDYLIQKPGCVVVSGPRMNNNKWCATVIKILQRKDKMTSIKPFCIARPYASSELRKTLIMVIRSKEVRGPAWAGYLAFLWDTCLRLNLGPNLETCIHQNEGPKNYHIFKSFVRC